MVTQPTAQPDRKDVIWQQPSTTASYHRSRQGIPFAEDHFDIVRRVLDAHGVVVRRLLDVGAGDGIATQAMLDRYPVERATLVDFSAPMLQAARDRFSGQEIDVRIVHGDLLGSDWALEVRESAGYDLVISRFAIHHLPDNRKRTLYAEILQLLLPGGMFVNLEHVKSPNANYQRAFEQMLIEGIHALAADDQTIEETERAFHARQDVDTNILAPVEDQCDWLREIGYVDIDCSFKALELAVFGGRRAERA